MKSVLASISLVAALVLLIGLASVSPASGADGKALFLEKKCNLCHSISSQEIQKKSEKMKGKDLSNVGNEVAGADFLKGWLQKAELVDGKKHKKTWKGTDEEMSAIINWLLTLKAS